LLTPYAEHRHVVERFVGAYASLICGYSGKTAVNHEAVDCNIHHIAAPNDLHAAKQGLQRQMVELVAQEWQLCVGRRVAAELREVRSVQRDRFLDVARPCRGPTPESALR
jgi:hypothetical protein